MVINLAPASSAMRIVVLVALAFLLAGCTQGTPVRDAESFGTCPSWTKLPYNGQIIEGNLQWTNVSTNPNDLVRWDFKAPSYNQSTGQWKPGNALGDGSLREYDDHPLDQIVLNFHLRKRAEGEPSRFLYVQDGTLKARFYASDDGLVGAPVSAYDEMKGPASAKHEWSFEVNPQTNFAIHNITLRIDLASSSEPPAPHGVFVQWELLPNRDRNPNTASLAAMHYSPEFWYRTCSKDGTRH